MEIGLPVAASAAGCSCCSTGATSASTATVGAGTNEFAVEGLTCGHCVQTVEGAVAALGGVGSASVDLVSGGRSRLVVVGGADEAGVREAVTSAGYTLSSDG